MSIFYVETVCPICNERHIISVQKSQYDAWQAGVLIQKAMPELSPDDREMLITGIDPKCWKSIFNNDNEEDF